MLSNFLESYIKFEKDGNILKFKPLTVDNMFSLLAAEPDFIIWIFEGAKTDKMKIIEDKEEFTNYVYQKYPTVIKTIIALSYIDDEKESLTIKEKITAIENMDFNFQLEIFNEITKKTFAGGVFSEVKKTKTAINEIAKRFQMGSSKT